MFERPLRYYYLRIMRQSGTSTEIAQGMAIGIFVGLLLPPGIQMVLALFLAILLKANRVVALLSCWISNPLTFCFIYPFYFQLGKWMTGLRPKFPRFPGASEEAWHFVVSIFKQGGGVAVVCFVGALTSAVVGSIISYYLTKFTVESFRRRRERQLQCSQELAPERAEAETPKKAKSE